jgi:ribosomal-protein-alanine N-acetyltransferase
MFTNIETNRLVLTWTSQKQNGFNTKVPRVTREGVSPLCVLRVLCVKNPCTKNKDLTSKFLKCIDHGDRDFIFEEFQNDFINRYLYDEEPMTDISQADKLIDFYTVAEPRNQNRWVLIDKTTNVKLGTCGYHLWNPDNKDVEIGFDLLEQYNGKGYMRESIEALIEFARHKMKVERINAIVSIKNNNCIKLLERLGFTKVGEEATEFRGQIYLHNIYTLKI